ncbi:MAG: hypothetical protein RR593_07060 [Hungatella sp.]
MMTLVDCIKKYRAEKDFSVAELFGMAYEYMKQESTQGSETYTSAEVAEILGAILGIDPGQSETPAAGTAEESR